MPDLLNKPISSSPGSFQQQIKGFVGPLLVCSTFHYSGLNGPLWEKHCVGMGWHERGWRESKVRLIPLSANRNPVFPSQDVCQVETPDQIHTTPSTICDKTWSATFSSGFIDLLKVHASVCAEPCLMHPPQRQNKSLHRGPWVALKGWWLA